MVKRMRMWGRRPVCLLALVAGLLALVVQSGELGSADTQHRMQTTHSLWTSEPPVLATDYPEFGLIGAHGEIESWYGIGQSLLTLPADVVGTWIERRDVFAGYAGTDPGVRNIVISVTTNVGLSVLTAVVCFGFLGRLGFGVREAAAGVVALLFGTTHLHYTQSMMENNYIFLLTLVGFSQQYKWLRTGKKEALLVGSAAFGLNLLTRLTTGLDLLAGGLFLAGVMLWERMPRAIVWARVKAYCAIAVPVVAAFGLADRVYQHRRFGSWVNTYITIFGEQARRRDPSLPLKYPFETPFHDGFFGALFQPQKSIFLFDPLLVVMVLVGVFGWKRFRAPVKAYVVATAVMVVAYIAFYARYTVWSGDFAWGDRYVETAAQFAALLAVPLLVRYSFWRGVRAVAWGLVGVSVAVQAASVVFWCPLELYQRMTPGHTGFIVALRFENIAAFALGKMESWGLVNSFMREDPWDWTHITTWNFLPCVLGRVGVGPLSVVRMLEVVWLGALMGLGWGLWRLWRVVE
jgi:hypothetical protein